MTDTTNTPTSGPCDYCGHADGHLIPGGSYSCESCFYTYDPEE